MYQWYLILWVFVVGLLTTSARMLKPVKINGVTEYRYTWIPVLAIALPMIYLAGTRENMGFSDTSVYKSAFQNLPSSLSGVSDYLTDEAKDKGFTYFSVFLKSIIGNEVTIYFTIIAAICILCVVFVYKKYSCNFMMSMFLFIASADYIQWTYNGIRQFLAVAILFACAGLIMHKKYIPVIVLILLLSTIHASALLMLPVIFIVQGKALNRKTILMLIGVLITVTFIDKFTDVLTDIMENTQYKGEVDQYLSTAGTSILRVIVYSIPAFLALIFRRRIDAANDSIINLSVNMSVACFSAYFLSAFSSGLFIGRIPIYFSLYNYILLPWIIEKVFTKKSSKIIYGLMIILYLIYYYYQVVLTWGI